MHRSDSVNNLYQVIENAANRHGDNPAVVFHDHRLSFTVLKEAVDRLAQGLLESGVKPGYRLGLMLPNIPHFIIGYYALLKIGVTVLPISIFDKAEEIRHKVEDAGIQGILYWEGFRSHVRKAVKDSQRCSHLFVLGGKADAGEVRMTALMERHEPKSEIHDVEADDTALIAYTAGFTGSPMGVELTHGNILFNISACINFLDLKTDDGVVAVFPLYHPLGHVFVMGTFLSAGARVILLPEFDAKKIIETIVTEKPTYFIGVPSMYRALLKEEAADKIDRSSLKFCISSGEAMKEDTMKAFEEKFNVPILECYGLTEATAVVSMNNPARERRAGSIGLPLPGIDLKIVDENTAEVRPGVVGEIIVKASSVMKGYLNQPDETAKAIKEGWLHTGDLALLHETGFGFVVVREENVIVKAGFNIFPGEVEAYLCEYTKIKEAAVVGIPDTTQGEDIHACIVLHEGEEASPEEIVEYCKGGMAAYKCPSVIHFVTSIPKGPTGRLIRDKVKHSLIAKKDK